MVFKFLPVKKAAFQILLGQYWNLRSSNTLGSKGKLDLPSTLLTASFPPPNTPASINNRTIMLIANRARRNLKPIR